MGRKKKNRIKKNKSFSIVRPKNNKPAELAEKMRKEREDEAEEEKVFFEYCDTMGYATPHVFTYWKNYFVDRASFLKAARKWANQKEAGIEGAIETDAAKGKTSYATNQVKSGNVAPNDPSLFSRHHSHSKSENLLTTGEKADRGCKVSVNRLQANADYHQIDTDQYNSWVDVEEAIEKEMELLKKMERASHQDQEFDDEYWQWYSRKEYTEPSTTRKHWGGYYINKKTLPLTPKIEAPTGKSIGVLVSL